MGYKIKLRNNKSIIVNTKDEIISLLRDRQIRPDTHIFDTSINLELMVSDVISQNELNMYYSESSDSYSNISASQNLNSINLSGQNVNVSRSRKTRFFAVLMLIIILFGGTVIMVPKIKHLLVNKAQKDSAKEFIMSHIDNLLGHKKPKKQEFNQEKFGDNYKLLQSLNESYAEYYTTFEKYLTYEDVINDKDFKKSQRNIKEILPVLNDCIKKYTVFVSELKMAADKYNVNFKKDSENVDSYIKNAKRLKLEYYNLEIKFCENIIDIRELLKKKEGTYRIIGNIYMFQNEEDKHRFDSLGGRYNSYSQKLADCSTKMNYLGKGIVIDIKHE